MRREKQPENCELLPLLLPMTTSLPKTENRRAT